MKSQKVRLIETEDSGNYRGVRSMGGASQVLLIVKNQPANPEDLRDVGSIPGSGRSPGVGHGNLLQVSLPGESHGQKSPVAYIRTQL